MLDDHTVQNRRHSSSTRRRKSCWLAILIFVVVALAVVIGIFIMRKVGEVDKVTYNGDMLLRAFPVTDMDRKFLQSFDKLKVPANVWGLPKNQDVPVYIYVKSGAFPVVENAFKAHNLTFEILVQDWQRLIDNEEKTIANRRSQHPIEKGYDFENYQTYDETVEYLRKLSQVNATSFIDVTSLGLTHEQRDLWLVKLSHTQSSLNKKPIVYINCGIHAREWISTSVCIWMINQLANNATSSDQLLKHYDWWFVPMANPDGLVYSSTTDRMWRKNRSPTSTSCMGVDLNRNFDIGFNETDRDTCSSGYGGPTPFSEIETKSVVDLLDANKDRIKVVLFMHSFSQLWLSPYGINSSLPKDYSEMERVMSKGVEALKSTYGTEFQYGSIANVLYTASGTAIDYCYKQLGIVYSFLIELRDQGRNGFILPIDQILPTAVETWNGIQAMLSAVKEAV